MKRTNKKTLLAGLLLSALTVPLTANAADYTGLNDALTSSGKQKTYDATSDETITTTLGNIASPGLMGKNHYLNINLNGYDVTATSDVDNDVFVGGTYKSAKNLPLTVNGLSADSSIKSVISGFAKGTTGSSYKTSGGFLYSYAGQSNFNNVIFENN